MSAVPSFPEKAGYSLRVAVVYGAIIFLFILNVVAADHALGNGMRLPIFLMVIYYWSVYRPTLLPVWLVFGAGVLYDLLAGLPVGMTAFSYVFLQWLVTDQRVFLMGQPYIMLWSGFALIALIAGAIQWSVYSLIHFDFIALRPVLASAALGALCFPVGTLFLRLTHKILPENHVNFGS